MLANSVLARQNNWSPLDVSEERKSKMNGSPVFSPVGLKVLVVDDNRVCLAVLKKMLQQCHYSVTACNSAVTALSLVQDNSISFDLVLCDVHMPGMDGFKLLEAIGVEQDLPVIMMSSDDETDVVMKGIVRGACDYFLKPVCLQRLQTIWQHVFRRREMGESTKDSDFTDSDSGRGPKFSTERDNPRKRKGKEEAMDELAEFVNGSKKKTRLVWTTTLHKQFVEAVKNLGTANAVPKQILEKMNVKGISRENVASHLQKYRKYLIEQETTMYDEMKDLAGGMNMHPHLIEPSHVRGNFGGFEETQPGAINTLSRTISALHSPQALTSGCRLNTELYPVPSLSFQAIEARSFKLGVNSDLFAVPSLAAASSSNFIHRTGQFPGLADEFLPTPHPTAALPAFYSTNYCD